MGAKMGMSKMAENRAIKESAMKAKPMYATKMNEQRILLIKREVSARNH